MKTIAKIALLLLFVSCAKEIDTVTIEMNIVYWQTCDTKPDYILMETDKGLFEFDYIEQSGGGEGVIEIPSGIYRISSVKLYDTNNELAYFVYEGVAPDTSNNPVVSWTNGYEYDFTKDAQVVFQVFCSGFQFPEQTLKNP